MSKLYAQVQKLDVGELVDLYEIDLTPLGGELLLFHGYMQIGPILFAGKEYQAWPIVIEGVEQTSEGPQPSPTLAVSNIGSDVNGDALPGIVSALCIQYQDMVGAFVTMRRTLGRFLDAANFPQGNPEADPSQQYPAQRWRIEQKLSEDSSVVTLQLANALDAEGRRIPDLTVQVSVCAWTRKGGYRGPYCGYAGAAMFDMDDNPTTDPAKDKCPGRLSSCRLRQSGFLDGVLNFMACPAADRITS